MSRFQDIQLDDDCLQRAVRGERAAQRQLYEQIAGPMFSLARRVLRNRASAEDAFQDSMIAVMRHLPAWRGEAPLGAWVRQITLNQCLMHLRSPWQKARSALDHLVAGAADELPQAELPLAELVDLERALTRLSDTSRTVLWLHDVEGLTHEEIAAAFGRSTSFSKSQLARAHALLRAELDGDERAASLVRADMTVQGQLP